MRLGGIVDRAPHPAMPDMPLAGGPQMVEVSRDGKRVYFTNSLYSAWDKQFYPAGVPGQLLLAHVGPDGGLTLDERFAVDFGPEFGAHQVRLEGGDCSTDSYCYPSA